jgi:hypothetical protein
MWPADRHLVQDDLVNEVTGYGLSNRGSIPDGTRDYFFTTTSTKPSDTMIQSLAKTGTSLYAVPPTQ